MARVEAAPATTGNGLRQLALLGPVELVLDGAPRPTRGRELDVLAVLALHRPAPTSMRSLTEGMWITPPATAAKTAQNLVARLRKSLGDTAILTDAQGYRLGDGWALDVEQFDRELSNAALAARTGDALARRDHLGLALGLVRGEPLASMEATALVARRRTGLVRAIDQAREDLVMACLDAGRADEGVRLTTEWVELMPHRERMWLLHAISLARSGERRAAINVLHRGRRDLRERAGLRVGHAFARLETLLLTDDPAVAATPADVLVDAARRVESFTTAGEQLFVGRTRQLAETAAVLDDAARRAVPRMLVATGVEGSGRSAFGRRVAIAARAEGWTVVRAACRAASVKPLEPFGDLVDELLRASPRLQDDVARARFDVLAGLREEAGDGPETESVAPELVALLGEQAVAERTLCVIDNAGRMLPSSRRVLDELLAGGGALVVLLLTGDDDPLTLAADGDRVHRVQLDGLDPAETGQLYRLLTGRSPDAATVAEVHRSTAGNPTLVRELAVGVDAALEDVADVEASGPVEIESAIERVARARVGRLAPAARSVAAVIALTSGPVDHAAAVEVAAALGVEEPAIALADAIARGVVDADDQQRLRIATSSLDRALLDTVEADWVDAAHESWWRVLTAHGASPLVTVQHALATSAREPARAVEALDVAANTAGLNGMLAEAAAYMDLACQVLARDHPSTARTILHRRVERADMLRYAKDPRWEDEARDVVRVAQQVGDHDSVAEAIGLFCALGPSTGSGQLDTDLATLVEDSLARCTDDGVLARAAARASLFYSLGDYERCRHHFDVALAAARRRGDPDTLAYVLGMVYTSVTDPLELDLRHQLALELVVLAERLDSPFHRFEALHLLFTTQLQRGDPLLRATMATMSGIGQLIPGTFKAWLEGYLRAALLHLDGRLDASLALAEQVRAAAPVAPSRADTSFMVQLLGIRFAEGRHAETAEPLRAIAESQPTMHAWRAFEAWPAACTGRWEFVEWVCELTDDGHSLPRDMTWMGSVFLLARGVALWCHRGAGAVAHGRRVYELLAPCTGQMTFVGCCTFGPIDLALAELALGMGDRELAADHLARARRVCDAIHAPVYTDELDRLAAEVGG